MNAIYYLFTISAEKMMRFLLQPTYEKRCYQRETSHSLERKWSCNAKLVRCGLAFSHLHSCTHTDVYRLTYGNMHAAQTHLQQTDLDDSTPIGSLNRASEHLLKTNSASFRKLFLFTPLIRGVVIYFHSHFMHPKLHECFSILTLPQAAFCGIHFLSICSTKYTNE